MKIILIITVLISSLAAYENSKLYECTKIFEQRKGELVLELERIDEQRQALESLKIATDELLNNKEVFLDQKEKRLNSIEMDVNATKKLTQEMLEENKKVLKEIKELKMDAISKTYSKMKAANAANILSKMDKKEASKILSTLKPKTVGAILGKMKPVDAAKLTSEISKVK